MSLRPDRGSVNVELVVLAPMLTLMMIFIVFLGRAGGAVEQVRHAADVAARAASLVAEFKMAAVATETAAADLAANGVNCASTSVAVAIDDAPPGPASVTVSVTCSINLDSTTALALGARDVSANSTEVIDVYRGRS